MPGLLCVFSLSSFHRLFMVSHPVPHSEPSPLPLKAALSCLVRTAAVNAAVTARGMQQLGLVFIMAPALRVLYPDDQARKKAFARYTGHSNTHAFMMPCYAGVLLNLEAQAAAGKLPEAMISGLKQTIATTLSALGDSFFSGALRTLWALSCICLLLAGKVLAAGLLTASLLLLLWAFRVAGFFYCLKNGIAGLKLIRKVDLVSWTERIKIANGILTACMLFCMLKTMGWECALAVKCALLLFVPAAAFAVGRLHLSRVFLWLAALCLLILYDQQFFLFF